MEISVYIAVPIAAWLVAQLLKYLLAGLQNGAAFADPRLLYKSGDMPSSHAAIIVALLVVVGVRDGFGTGLFGVVVTLAGIVLYDAVNVRRAVGEQGAVLQKLAKQAAQKHTFFNAKGHTPLEVLAGSTIGVAVSVLLLQFL